MVKLAYRVFILRMKDLVTTAMQCVVLKSNTL